MIKESHAEKYLIQTNSR